jgi:tungstate transport system substrate-binding protein
MRGFTALLLAWICLLLVGAAPAEERARDDLLLATTTSVRDSGLFEQLVPLFQERTGISVRLVAVGSGAALQMGAEGNADVLVTHAPEGEKELVREGLLVDRRSFMQNYFLIAGPTEDPAGVRDAVSAADAIRRIVEAKARFVSRADDSGTHRREVALFREAEVDPDREREGLVRTGAGMGLSLQVAGERRAYILSDLGTFRAFRKRIDLVALSRPDPALLNIYSVLRPNPARFPPDRLEVEGAKRFAEFLLSPDVAERIGAFGREASEGPLFTPLSPEPKRADRTP